MPQASSIRAEVTGQWRSSSVAWYNDARIRANASWSLTASFFLQPSQDAAFFARRIAGSVLQALPRRLVTTRIGRIRKETIQEAAEAGELPDDEHVARSARAHAAVESRAVVAGTGREVVVDVDSVDARGLQCVAL